MIYRTVTNRRFWFIALCCLPVFVLFAWLEQPGRGFVAALSVAGMLGVVSILADIAHGGKFWIVVGLIAIAHALLVFLLPWPDFHFPGIVFSPLVIADMYGCARLLMLVGAAKPE